MAPRQAPACLPPTPPPPTPPHPQAPVQGAEVVDVTAKAAVGFIFMASAMLLVLFFFLSKAFFMILLTMFTLATTQSLSIWLLAVAGHMLPSLKDRHVELRWLGEVPVLALAVVPLSMATCITWAVFRNAWWSWVLQVGPRLD
jgi:signal peptide peptidase-like protein 2B